MSMFRKETHLGILVGGYSNELGLRESVCQNPSFISANSNNMDSGLVLVKRIEHNLFVG